MPEARAQVAVEVETSQAAEVDLLPWVRVSSGLMHWSPPESEEPPPFSWLGGAVTHG